MGLCTSICGSCGETCGETCDKSSSLKDCSFQKTAAFTLEDKVFVAKVIDIYDGDTVTCAFELFGNYYKFTVRLYGIDTCELHSKNREQALRARMRLYELVTRKPSKDIDLGIARKNLRTLLEDSECIVVLKCGNFDKYGRLLGKLYASIKDENSFNEILVAEKLAYPYYGDKKLTDDEQTGVVS
jgi:endonuclease YncB( thermonuclease family)